MTPGEEKRPDLAAVLGELLGGKGKEEAAPEKEPEPQPEPGEAPPRTAEAETASAPSAGGEAGGGDNGEAPALAGLLSNPELLRMIPVVLSLVTSLGGGAPQKSALPAAPKSEGEKRAALLRAVKPYLSPERADAVEIVLKVTELIDLLK